ncbi:MAG: hypothetical protein VCA57_00850 [Pseudomonas sp.]|uniref:hypothetical protein n=1 Tax=Pseudomonas sp. TaxID=306 RepID=UPI00398230F4
MGCDRDFLEQAIRLAEVSNQMTARFDSLAQQGLRIEHAAHSAITPAYQCWYAQHA